MFIAIPTYKREENQKCYSRMPESVQELTNLVTHSGREELLKEQLPEANVHNLGDTDGIADVRQKLIEYAESLGHDKIMIIDDGCTFKKRVDMKLVHMDESDWAKMFLEVDSLLDEYAMVGISDQAGNNRVEEDLLEAQRSYSCYGVNIKFFKDHGIRFDGMYQKDNDIKLYEDFYVVLKLLTSGFKNAVIFNYAFSHAHGKKGGNSEIRNNELQRKCIQQLIKEFPGLVKLTKKDNPSWKAGLNDEDKFRWEVKISWKLAYNTGLQQKESVSLW